jgi:PiT family inorganic phosphate transporter
MISSLILFLATSFLSYSNGANDNFKGVATLFGSKTTSYKTAIWWATITTFAGSVSSIFLAQTLVKSFSGKGLVPDAIIASPHFLLSVALAAGTTVMLASVLGFPISTTHGLTGALLGSVLAAVGTQVNFAKLGSSFFLPLILSPLIAGGLGAILYLIARSTRIKMGITKEWCICIGETEQLVPIAQTPGLFFLGREALPQISVATQQNCTQRYSGNVVGIGLQKIVDAAHFLTAGSVSFARGLNDTPKIVALLLVIEALGIQWGMVAVALGMAIGGLINAKKVAETMSKKITELNHGQGFTSNFVTAMLVIFASRWGMPVSTTHVSVGSLFGIGLITKQAHYSVIGQILLSWVLTLPIAAILGAAIYLLSPV